MLLTFTSTTGAITLESILWPIFAGIVIAAMIALYNKHITGRFVMKLISEKAIDKESARSLKELGFEKNRAVRFALRTGELYNKIISHDITAQAEGTIANDSALSSAKRSRKAKGKESISADRYDIDSAVFYVSDEHIDRAKLLYSRNGAPILLVFLAMLLFCLAIAALFYVLPELSKMLGNLGSKISSLWS